MILIIYIYSVLAKSLEVIPWLIPLDFVRIIINQSLIFLLEHGSGSYELALHFFQNFLSMHLAYTLGRFIDNKKIKLSLKIIHYLFSITTWILISIVMVEDFLHIMKDHYQDALYLVFVLLCLFAIQQLIVE